MDLGECFFQVYSFPLLKFGTLDLTMISTLHSCILLLIFPKNHWAVSVVILVYSTAAGREAVTQLDSYGQVRWRVAGNNITGGKGVKGFHFPLEVEKQLSSDSWHFWSDSVAGKWQHSIINQ